MTVEFTEEQKIEIQQMLFAKDGESALRRSIAYIAGEVKMGYVSQGEYNALVVIFNQFMKPREEPKPQLEPTPE